MTGESDVERAALGIVEAGLALGDFDPAAVPAVLPEAVAAGAAACERWGALD